MSSVIKKVDAFLGKFEVTHVHNDSEYNNAFELLKKIKKAVKLLDQDRKERTKDLLAEKRAIDAEYKPGLDRAKEIERDLKTALQEYKAKKEEERRKLTEGPITREKMDALAEAHTPEPQGLSTRKVKKLVIEREDLIPREYVIPNERLILEDLRQGKEVPGCRLVEEEILAVRT